ncbi:MAG: hypothetical protein M3116_00120 [Actinomycetota bacterium]|nr:hypothetical protein [Actinomycetota bacterium]
MAARVPKRDTLRWLAPSVLAAIVFVLLEAGDHPDVRAEGDERACGRF